MNAAPLLSVRSVSKSYGKKSGKVEVLHDVDLELRNGDLVLLTGASGAGKTTLLNLLAALDRPDKGEILVDGVDIARLSRSAAARYRNERVGMVFQSYNLLPQLTAVENVLLPMIPRRRSNPTRAFQLLDAVGLASRSKHKPPELSGGEQQRVAIARALANDPPLILADEPTGNLDDETAGRIMALLRDSCRERGKTLLLVSHDRNVVRTADAVLELRAGSLCEARQSVRTSSQCDVSPQERCPGGRDRYSRTPNAS